MDLQVPKKQWIYNGLVVSKIIGKFTECLTTTAYRH
jgi:hypothetical protein